MAIYKGVEVKPIASIQLGFYTKVNIYSISDSDDIIPFELKPNKCFNFDSYILAGYNEERPRWYKVKYIGEDGIPTFYINKVQFTLTEAIRCNY